MMWGVDRTLSGLPISRETNELHGLEGFYKSHDKICSPNFLHPRKKILSINYKNGSRMFIAFKYCAQEGNTFLHVPYQSLVGEERSEYKGNWFVWTEVKH